MGGLFQHAAIEVLDEDLEQLEHVDLAIELVEWDDRTPITMVGGRWDIEDDDWSLDPHETSVRWRVQPAQYEAARFFAKWLKARACGERVAGFEDIYTLFGVGGRGAGKSDFGVRAGILYCVAFKQTIAWYVSPVIKETKELQRAIEEMVPDDWYHFADNTYHFWNGSTITLMSGYDPGTLKQGRVDYFLLNEAQRFPLGAYKMVAPRIADRSGIGYLACNPPREAKGRWVMDFYDRLKSQEAPDRVANDNDILDIRLIEFEAKKNPTIDWHRLELLRATFGDLDYRREIEGEMLPIGDIVFYAWSAAGNVQPVPELGDITRRWTQKRLGRAADYVISMDFNKKPHMSATCSRLFTDPRDAKGALSWFTHEWLVRGDEFDLLDAIEAVVDSDGRQVFTPENTVLVVDASGWWQNPERTKGSPSQERLASRGYYCYRPVKRFRANPLIPERVLVGNARLRAADGVRRTFVAPTCTALAEAFKNLPNKYGKPDGRSDYAHIIDAATYFLIRFFPRSVVKLSRFQYDTVERVPTDRERDLDAW